MLTILTKQQGIDIDNYADKHASQLLAVTKRTGYLDRAYMRSMLNDLGGFATLVRLEALADQQAMQYDISYATRMQEQYGNVQDYCYDQLSQCYDATNEVLHQCNALLTDLSDATGLRNLSVASDCIAIGLLGNAQAILSNFCVMPGLGLCYDISVRCGHVITSKAMELVQSKLNDMQSVAKFLQAIEQPELADKLASWHAIVNESLATAKGQAVPAWLLLYKASSPSWGVSHWSKLNGHMHCELSLSNELVSERLSSGGKTRSMDYGSQHDKVVLLDYINFMNVKLSEAGE